jgi:hypothetical protein
MTNNGSIEPEAVSRLASRTGTHGSRNTHLFRLPIFLQPEQTTAPKGGPPNTGETPRRPPRKNAHPIRWPQAAQVSFARLRLGSYAYDPSLSKYPKLGNETSYRPSVTSAGLWLAILPELAPTSEHSSSMLSVSTAD